MNKTTKKSIAVISGIFGILAVSSASANELNQAEERVVETASRAIYMNEFCGTDIEKEKFFEVAKLAAEVDGASENEVSNIDFNELRNSAHRAYYDYALANPNGTACERLLERTANVLPMMESQLHFDSDKEMIQ